jgi:sigma-54 dependent transcriptional regulator, acetoin dehydrogenase operon transcriptional activator AcoR
VGRDGRFLGANRSALDQLGMSCSALRMNTLGVLFGTTLGAVVDHFRSPMATPMPLQLTDGRRLHMRAVFNWPTWHTVGSVNVVDHDATSVPNTPPPASTGSFFGAASGARPATASDAATASASLSGLRYLQTGDAQMEAVIAKVRRVLNRDISVLVLGETGTGKELLARAIHQDSNRSRHPFVAVNCASIPESLIESELFGYEEGAFTGARRKGGVGKIVQAHGGTLFLDEIGDMPLPLQARLLRVLQERQVTPLGSSKSVPVDVAVVSATHRNLRDMISAQTFREDLYYRLNGLVVRVPALRERSDLMVIVNKILRAEANGLPPELTGDVINLLQDCHWPGNIRQLANVLRTAAVMAAGEAFITREHLSDDFLEDVLQRRGERPVAPAVAAAQAVAAEAEPAAPEAPATTLEAMEIETIRRALDEAGGNISVASKRLGISRNTIYRKLRWRQQV